jgi:glycolate oxidase iron-sulfur subunit
LNLKRNPVAEGKGPQEESKYLEDLAKCVRCGICKAQCPTYAQDPLEPLGARGRIMLLHGLVTGKLAPSNLLTERIFSCVLCGACSASCPLGVDITAAIYRGRALLADSDRRRRYVRYFAKYLVRYPDFAFRMARLSQRLIFPRLVKMGIIPFSPRLPEAPFRKTEQVLKAPKKKGRVAVFTGCSVKFIFPQFGESLVNVLQKFGYEVILPKGEVCCGVPLRGLGLEKEAAELAKRNYRVFNRLKVDAVLSLCPTCTMALRDFYPGLIGKGLENAMDISVFFSDKIGPAGSIQKSAFYHDPCHLGYGLGVRKEPREIVRKAGLDLIAADDQACCGFGGLFCLSYKDISNSLLQKRAERIKGSGADVVVTSCPGCILQLSRAVTDRPVLHLIELIEEAYCYRPLEKKEQDAEKELTLF